MSTLCVCVCVCALGMHALCVLVYAALVCVSSRMVERLCNCVPCLFA